MKSKHLLLLLVLTFGPGLLAQSFQSVVGVVDSCDPTQTDEDNQEAELIVDQFMAQMALSRHFRILKCPQTKNAEAKLVKDENGNLVQFLLYDPVWLEQLTQKSSTNWAAIGVLAHEVGHLLLSHSLNNKGSNPRWELEADRFLGGTLARMGSSLDEAQSCFLNAPINATSTHPAREDRMEAIKIGWQRVNNLLPENIVVNQLTPHEAVTSSGLITRYFKELGDTEDIRKILRLKYTENVTEYTIKNREKLTPSEFAYSYEQYAPTTIRVSWDNPNGYLEQYLVQNDELFFKYQDQNKWKEGPPPNGTSKPDEKDIFLNEIYPSTVVFFDQLILLSNPEFASYSGSETFEDFYLNEEIAPEECWALEVPKKILTVGDPPKKGKVIEVFKKNYYSIKTGLLHGILEERRVTLYSKGGRQRENVILTRKTILDNYKSIEGVKFPFKYYQLTYETDDGFPVEGTEVIQHRIISNLEINPELDLKDLQL